MKLCERCKAPMQKQVFSHGAFPRLTATLMQMTEHFPMLIWWDGTQFMWVRFHYPHLCGGGFV